MALRAVALSLITYTANAQVGIGTTLPQAKLHVHDGSVLGTSEVTGPENHPFHDPTNPKAVEYRLKWFHDKGALRSVNHAVGKNFLNPGETGNFSFASGFEASAKGVAGTSIGIRTEANGKASLAAGYASTADGLQSFAQGTYCTASGNHSFAMGYQVSTNFKNGSFIFGDDNGSTQNDADDQMMMRFAGGYKFFSNANATIGVILAANANSWATISDVNKKENFAPVNGEDFLQKISKMNLTSWNYKGQDPKAFRHYGPMAQDFYNAFGRDGYGSIGSDTTINQADFDGVNLIAIQALVKRTEELNDRLMSEIMALRKELELTNKTIQRKKARVASK